MYNSHSFLRNGFWIHVPIKNELGKKNIPSLFSLPVLIHFDSRGFALEMLSKEKQISQKIL